MNGGFRNTMNTYIDFFRFLGYNFNRSNIGYINAQVSNAATLMRYYFTDDPIFVHINKTGGSSIERALKLKEQNHLTAQYIRDHMGTTAFNKKFKFAFVRNPFDKVVSQYEYRAKHDQTGIRTENVSFEDWVFESYEKRNMKYINNPTMFMPQYYWITDYEGNEIVDFVGRFENLQNDFNQVCKMLKRDVQLPHVRKTNRRPYQDYYNDETQRIIQKHYKVDLDYFNYQFN